MSSSLSFTDSLLLTQHVICQLTLLSAVICDGNNVCALEIGTILSNPNNLTYMCDCFACECGKFFSLLFVDIKKETKHNVH